MIVLVFVACLMANPGSCREASPAYEARYPSVRACISDAQNAAIRWQDRHPGWTIRRWTCGGPTT